MNSEQPPQSQSPEEATAIPRDSQNKRVRLPQNYSQFSVQEQKNTDYDTGLSTFTIEPDVSAGPSVFSSISSGTTSVSSHFWPDEEKKAAMSQASISSKRKSAKKEPSSISNSSIKKKDLLTSALPSQATVIFAKCGCGYVHSIVTLPEGSFLFS